MSDVDAANYVSDDMTAAIRYASLAVGYESFLRWFVLEAPSWAGLYASEPAVPVVPPFPCVLAAAVVLATSVTTRPCLAVKPSWSQYPRTHCFVKLQ